jgi:hypothetical protein
MLCFGLALGGMREYGTVGIIVQCGQTLKLHHDLFYHHYASDKKA